MRNLTSWANRPSSILPRNSNTSPDPFFALQNDINNLFQEAIGTYQPYALWGDDLSAGILPVDVLETEKSYRIEAEIPGIKADNIDVSFGTNSCTIKCTKQDSEENKSNNYLRRERSFGACQRTVPLPESVDADKADASFKNGVLWIDVPKKAEAVANTKKIKVKTA